jgi:hypothetical protein
MNESEISSPFRLSTGGLFYRLMLRLRLVEANRYHPWRRITLFTSLTWLPLLILTAIDGTLAGNSVNIIFICDPVPHARYLIALPLLVFADWIIDPYMTAIVKHFQVSDLVPKDAKPLYSKALEQLIRRRDAAWVDVVLFGLAFSLVWILKFKFGISTLDIETSSWMTTTSGKVERLTPAGWWFISVSIPFIQFILYRWIWRLIIWIRFMNSLSRLGLALQSTHPDHMGGLGLLTSAQFSFGVIFTAFGATASATLANEIIHLGSTLPEVQLSIIGFVLICFAIITGPLCTFSGPLFSAKRHDLRHSSARATQLSEAFEEKWIKNTNGGQGEEPVTTANPSTVRSYGVIYETISSMRLIPLKRQNVIGLLIILVAPFIPLVFTQISIKEALKQLAQTLV